MLDGTDCETVFEKKILTNTFCKVATIVKYAIDGVFMRIMRRNNSFDLINSRKSILYSIL